MTLLSDIVDPPNPVTITLAAHYVGNIEINEPTATAITIAGVVTLGGGFRFSAPHAPKCKSISFPDLVHIVAPIDDHATADPGSGLRVHDAPLLKTFSAPLLQDIWCQRKSIYFMRLPALTTLNLPALTSVNWNKAHNQAFLIKETGLATIGLSTLQAILGPNGTDPGGSDKGTGYRKLSIIGNPALTHVDLSALNGGIGATGNGLSGIFISGNPLLVEISIGSFDVSAYRIKMLFNGDALPTSFVNDFFNTLSDALDSPGIENPIPLISIVGGTSGAPTGAALTKADARGWAHN